jgi:hypothetical protein
MSSAWGGVYGYGVTQASGYRQPMQTLQPIRAGYSYVVCPTPTSPSSVPNTTTETNGMHSPYFLCTVDEHNLLRPLTCDHTHCYPPSNVEFFSRRFLENGHWIQARASAVASLPRMTRGGELF